MRCATVLLVACLPCSAAAAAEVRIGDVSLDLPPPAGYCELNPTLATDAHLVANIHTVLSKTGNRLLLLSADCRELRDWRNGKRPELAHMAEYQTVLALQNNPLPDTPETVLKKLCDEMREMGGSAPTGVTTDVQRRAEEASAAIRVNEMKFLGVVGMDPLVCYASLLQKHQTETGEQQVQATVFATTIIKGKVVLHYLFAPYAAGETIKQMLAKQRTNVARLQAANR